jgi:hypothetical protein
VNDDVGAVLEGVVVDGVAKVLSATTSAPTRRAAATIWATSKTQGWVGRDLEEDDPRSFGNHVLQPVGLAVDEERGLDVPVAAP